MGFLCACALVLCVFFYAQDKSARYLAENPGSADSYAEPAARFLPGSGEYQSGFFWRFSCQTDNLAQWAKVPAHVLFGTGVNSFLPLTEATWGPRQLVISPFAHSDFVDWFVDYGLVGAVLLFWLLAAFLWPFFRPRKRARALCFLPLVFVLFLRGLVESDLHTSSGTLTFVLAIGLVYSFFFRTSNPSAYFPFPLKARSVCWALACLLFLAGFWAVAVQARTRAVVSNYSLDPSLGWTPVLTPENFENDARFLLDQDPRYPSNFQVAVAMTSWFFLQTHPSLDAAEANRQAFYAPSIELAQGLYLRDPNDLRTGALLAFLLAYGQQDGPSLELLADLEHRFPSHLTLLWTRALIASYKGDHQLAKQYLGEYLQRTQDQGFVPLGRVRNDLANQYLSGLTPVLPYWP